MELDNLKVDEVFSLLEEINKRYTAVIGWGLIENNSLVNFDEASFMVKTSGAEDYDLIEEFFSEFEFELEDGYKINRTSDGRNGFDIKISWN